MIFFAMSMPSILQAFSSYQLSIIKHINIIDETYNIIYFLRIDCNTYTQIIDQTYTNISRTFFIHIDHNIICSYGKQDFLEKYHVPYLHRGTSLNPYSLVNIRLIHK